MLGPQRRKGTKKADTLLAAQEDWSGYLRAAKEGESQSRNFIPVWRLKQAKSFIHSIYLQATFPQKRMLKADSNKENRNTFQINTAKQFHNNTAKQ